MNIPENIRIGSVDYEVVLTDENLVCNGRESYGWIDYNYHIIKINKNIQDKQGQEKTFLHEVIHGIIRERSLDVTSTDDEEVIVEEIAIGIHQVIRDNPGIFEWVVKQYLNTGIADHGVGDASGICGRCNEIKCGCNKLNKSKE